MIHTELYLYRSSFLLGSLEFRLKLGSLTDSLLLQAFLSQSRVVHFKLAHVA